PGCRAASPSAEAYLAHAILEVFGAFKNFDFDTHEIDRQVAPIDFRKTHGVLLRGDDAERLALLAAVHHVEHFLLGKPVMIGKALGIHQLGPQLHKAALETFRLRNAAERRHFASLEQIEITPLTCKYILKIERMMNALDDPGSRVVARNAFPQPRGVAVALRDENRARARQMRRRFTQRPAREQLLVAE